MCDYYFSRNILIYGVSNKPFPQSYVISVFTMQIYFHLYSTFGYVFSGNSFLIARINRGIYSKEKSLHLQVHKYFLYPISSFRVVCFSWAFLWVMTYRRSFVPNLQHFSVIHPLCSAFQISQWQGWVYTPLPNEKKNTCRQLSRW